MNHGHGFISQEILAAFNQTLLGDPLRLEEVEVVWNLYEGDEGLIQISVADRVNPKNELGWVIRRSRLVKYIEQWRILYPAQREYYTSPNYPGELFRALHGPKGNLWKDAFKGWWGPFNSAREIDPADMIDCCWTVGHFDPACLYPTEESAT